MSQLLRLTGSQRVLEIGTGCGYQTAVLCELAGAVFSVEIVEKVAALGRNNLETLGYTPQLRVGDGGLGWEEVGPFDAVIITATAPRIPEALVEQVKVGGVIVTPLEEWGNEVMVRATRTVQGVDVERLYGVRFVPMTGAVRGG